MRRHVFSTLTITAALLALPAAALARAPVAITDGAHAVTYASALATGRVNPEGHETAYVFQYGPTRLYGGQTSPVSVGAGKHTVGVSAVLPGLTAATKYHFRLVALGTGGGGVGHDRTFTTAKIPLSLAIAVAPNPVTFGGTAAIQGTLSGTGNGGRVVVLQTSPFPYLVAPANFGSPAVTSATGYFVFFVPNLMLATKFQVVAAGLPSVAPQAIVENVAVSVTAHARRLPGRRRRVRFAGFVTPALNGAPVAIQRVGRKGRYVFAGGTVLRHRSASTSGFARVLRVRHPGIYRVLAQTPGGAYVSNTSAPIVVR